jgi:hypothetical protein
MANKDEVVVEEKPNNSWIGSAFDKTEDAELLNKYGFLKSIGGFGPSDIIRLGVKAALDSPQWKEKAKAFAASLPK